MGQKKLILTLGVCVSLIALTLTANPVFAGQLNTVRGYVYINGELASAGIDVKISFEDVFGTSTGDETDSTSSSGHYEINFEGRDYEIGTFYVYYSGEWREPEGNPEIEIEPEIIGYKYNLSIIVESPPPPPPPPPGPGPSEDPSSGGGGNLPPVADASLSDTTGFTGISVTFDGSKSSDSDGSIVSYDWDFGDGNTSSGVTTSHIFAEDGTFTVKLTVTDDGGLTATDEIDIVIAVPNSPPSDPVITGTHMGAKDTDYDISVVSTDVDDDEISYDIIWGDGDSESTDFFPSGNDTSAGHSYSAAGVYTIQVTASDNESESGSSSHVVLIDAWFVKDIGYLLDEDGDGIYETFYSNETGETTDSDQLKNETFIIDSDGEVGWDWFYDMDTDTISTYSEVKTTEEEDYTMWYLVIIAIIIIIIILLLATRKKKPEPKEPEPKKPANNPGPAKTKKSTKSKSKKK